MEMPSNINTTLAKVLSSQFCHVLTATSKNQTSIYKDEE